MSVRVARKSDEPELLRLLHLMHAEGGLLPLDVERARETFNIAFNRKGGIIGVIGDGKIEAATYLLITTHWYTRSHHLEELFCFVDPDHRQSTHAKSLIAFAKDSATALAMPLLIGIMTNKRMAPKVRLYRGQLGHPAGAYFIFNSRWEFAPEPAAEDFCLAVESRAEHRRRKRRLIGGSHVSR